MLILRCELACFGGGGGDEHPEDLVAGHDEPVITVVLPRLGSVKEIASYEVDRSQ
jgi:hypothetical protein